MLKTLQVPTFELCAINNLSWKIFDFYTAKVNFDFFTPVYALHPTETNDNKVRTQTTKIFNQLLSQMADEQGC